uniref:Uncharacterized protein n=1 Tax=Salix viminalis TaxID=40686 RepID=A0A6N2L9F7_SALVM
MINNKVAAKCHACEKHRRVVNQGSHLPGRMVSLIICLILTILVKMQQINLLPQIILLKTRILGWTIIVVSLQISVPWNQMVSSASILLHLVFLFPKLPLLPLQDSQCQAELYLQAFLLMGQCTMILTILQIIFYKTLHHYLGTLASLGMLNSLILQ